MFDAKLYFRVNKTEPTAIPGGGSVIDAISDVQGRQVMYPFQVRDLHESAYATLNSNNETSLFQAPAAVAASNSNPTATNAVFADLVHISGANTSSLAVAFDIRCGTGGAIVKTVALPASGTFSQDLLSPLPMVESNQTWTVKFNTTLMGSDISGTTVFVDASFVQNE